MAGAAGGHAKSNQSRRGNGTREASARGISAGVQHETRLDEIGGVLCSTGRAASGREQWQCCGVRSGEYRLCDVVRCPALLSIAPPPIVCGHTRAQRRRSIFNAPRCNIDVRPQLSVRRRCGRRHRHRHRATAYTATATATATAMAAINADASVVTVVNISGFIAVKMSSSPSLIVLIVGVDIDNIISFVVF